MPTVPLATGPQVKPNVVDMPGGQQVSAPNLVLGDFTQRQIAPLQQEQKAFNPEDPFRSAYETVQPLHADTGAQQEAATGAALGEASGAISDIVNRVQAQANALVTDNAVNQAKETAIRLAYDKDTGFTSLKGYSALNRPGGKPLADEYADKFDEASQNIANSLTNDVQRNAYQVQAQGIRTSLYGQATQHESQEFKNYNLSTQEGTIKLETDNIGVNYRDPDAVANSVTRIKGAVAEQGFAMGKAAVAIEGFQKDAVSSAYGKALDSALEDGNVVFADAFMRAHKDEMNPGDIMRVRGAITKEMDGRFALQSARDAINTAVMPTLQPTDLDRMTGITLGSESHGQDLNAQGGILTSSKGAQGKMQVMPNTQTDPGFGVTPARDDSLAEKARVGRDYLHAMVQRYNGDPAQAWAAYNAGPGRLDAALAAAKLPENQGKNWLQLMPAETQDYVTKNLAQLGAGGGAPPTPTLADALAKLDADPRVNTSLSRMDMARREVTARYEALHAAKKQGEDDGLANALKAVEANGGNYMGLSPQMRAAIPPEHIDTVMNFADKVRGGNTVTNLAVYQRLNDDATLKGMSDSQFYAMRPELSPDDFKHFDEQRAKLLGNTVAAGNAASDLNTPALRMTVNDRLQMLGINPTPDKKDTASMQRIGAVNKFVTDQTLLAQQQLGRKFTDAEQSAFVDKLFAKSVPFRNTVLGITTGHDNQRLLEMKPGDIPADARSKLQDAFKKRGINNPSDTDLLSAYWRTRMLAGG